MFKSKIRISLWILYIIAYSSVPVINYFYDSLPSFFVSLVLHVIIITGMIGYVAGFKIAYRIIWRIFFLILLLFASFGLILMIILSKKQTLIMLITFSPALYALHAYAYRSRHIWENQEGNGMLPS
jgi:hypothetical protein